LNELEVMIMKSLPGISTRYQLPNITEINGGTQLNHCCAMANN